MSIALEVKQLQMSYSKTLALWDISCEIPANQIIGIVGPNGAGKTTFLKAILDLVKPLTGSVKFFGKSLKKMRKKIAYVPQRSLVDWNFPITAKQLVLMGRYCHLNFLKRAKAEDKVLANKALKIVGMQHLADRQIGQLSKGQQQRLFIARAIAQDPDIFFLDEPFTGVDLASEADMIALFRELKQKGKTIFIVHHDMHKVKAYFDWILMINTCLIASGPLDSVWNKENMQHLFGKDHDLLHEISQLSMSKNLGY